MQIITAQSGALYVNTYFVVDEHTKKGFIIDPGGYVPAIAKKINNENIDIQYIILTHGHGDHIGGVTEFLKEFPNIKVVAHKMEREMLEDANFNMSSLFSDPCSVNADIFAEDGDELSVGGLLLKFIHTPGHSPGGMCIYIEKENVLFSGDTLFCQSIGRTDFPGCSLQELLDSIKNKLFVLPDETKVLTGHTGSTEIGFEKRNNPFVHM